MPAAIISAIVIVIALGVGILSKNYLGPDNPIEQEIEVIVETEIEQELHLPAGTLAGKIDLSPTTKTTTEITITPAGAAVLEP